jgi:hypothetical protein
MFKMLCAVATLLMLCAGGAGAQSVQASPSVSVVPPGTTVACDIGPPAAVPAAAAMAGFTHCAANWDFSQSTYAVLSNWADCDGSNPNVLWHRGMMGITELPPCNIKQKVDTDPATGAKVTVMNFKWLASHGQMAQKAGANPNANQIGLQTFNNWTNQVTWTVGNYYEESVDRLEEYCSACGGGLGGPNDIMAGPYAQNGATEVDNPEIYTDNGALAGCGIYCLGGGQWAYTSFRGGTSSQFLPSGWASEKYYKYGALHTSDGATDKRLCMYVNDVLQGAGCIVISNAAFTARNAIAISAGSNAGTSPDNIDLDVQYVRIWTCERASSMCNGTKLVDQTLSTKQRLSYYH